MTCRRFKREVVEPVKQPGQGPHIARGSGRHTRPGCATKEDAVILQGTDPRMIEAFESAGSLQFYQLKALIEGICPTRVAALPLERLSHLGQPVQSVDFCDGQMRRGKPCA